jgi:hypothetical protein
MFLMILKYEAICFINNIAVFDIVDFEGKMILLVVDGYYVKKHFLVNNSLLGFERHISLKLN